MQVRVLLLAGLAGLAACACEGGGRAGTSDPERPNIVLLMADDLGWGDVGFNGNTIIETPFLDALAADGMRFARFYAQSPVCSPTRGSCLTGRHPSRYGIFGANSGHLRADEVNLAQLLAQRGYATGHFGKWHLGTLSAEYSGKSGRNPAANVMTPAMAGFDEWFSTEYAVATWDPYDPVNKHGRYDVRNLYWDEGGPLGDAAGLVGDDSRIVMDRVVPFVREAVAADRPFFAVVWFHAPHEPVVGGADYRARYASFSEGEQHYFACITALDEQVGRLRRELDELGVARDTLVAFCSDNGPEGNPGPRGRSQGSSGPFRGRKRSLYEGGVRVPSVFVWPARIPAGTATEFPASTSDYLPTVCDLLAIERPSARPLDGISLRRVLAGEVFERPTPILFQTRGQRTVSGARFKLVRNLGDERPGHDDGRTPFARWELYDLHEDPGETRNVIAEHGALTAGWREALERFVASCESSLKAGER
jgi:arylsulfatase A-like enzyme